MERTPLETFHDEMSPLNDDALSNISLTLVTLETTYNEMPPLNTDECSMKHQHSMEIFHCVMSQASQAWWICSKEHQQSMKTFHRGMSQEPQTCSLWRAFGSHAIAQAQLQ